MNNIQGANSYLPQVFLQVLSEEIQCQSQKNWNANLVVPWAKWLYCSGDNHVYQIRLEEVLKESPDSYLQFWVQQQAYPGYLISAQGLSVKIAFHTYLGEEIFNAKLSFHNVHLLNKLQNTFKRLVEENYQNDLAQAVFTPLDPDGKTELLDNISFENFFPSLLPLKRLFVWGPAGTGKTQALAELGSILLSQGESIFISANTHVAVNNGIQRLLEFLNHKFPGTFNQLVPEGEILRYGFLEGQAKNSPEGQFPFSENPVSPENWMRLHHFDLWEKRQALQLANKNHRDQWEEWRKNNRHKTVRAREFQNQIIQNEHELQKIQRQWQDLLHEGVKRVRVLAATLTQVFLNASLLQRKFDTVIIDEASMALLPTLYLAATLALKRVIILGDFRQIPPIALSKSLLAQEWLSKDVFEKAGIPRWIEKERTGHQELLILRTQRRMRPAISKLCNEVFYHGLLFDDEACCAGEAGYEIPGVILYDSGQAKPWCTRRGRGEGKSRINLYQAQVAVHLAERTLLQGQEDLAKGIGIITPYREQAKLIQFLLEDRGIHQKVQVATVHQFQGEERDVIIWDTVDTEGFPIGALLKGAMGSNAARMINVALTRARKNLFIIADYQYLLDTLAPEDVLREIFEWIAKNQSGEISVIDARKLVQPVENFSNHFLKDLGSCQRNIVLSIPILFRALDETFLQELEKKRKQGVKILLDTLQPKLQREILKDLFVGPPKIINEENVVTIFHDFPDWHRFLQPNLIIMDDRLCWYGSHNLLRKEQAERWGNIFRLTGKQAIEDLNQFFGLFLLNEIHQLKIYCPLCNGTMVLMWNRRQFDSAGDFYAACAEGCGYKRPLLRGERGPEDGEPRWLPTRSKVKNIQKVLPGFLPLKAIPARIKTTDILDPCPQCLLPTAFRYKAEQYFFVGCSGWPSCDFKRNYQENCPDCGGQLVVRRSKHGIFLGCINFPRCRNTKDLRETTQNLNLSV